MKLKRFVLVLGLSALSLVLLNLYWPYGHAKSVMVGDIEIDPDDFSPRHDPKTRIAKCLACHGKHARGDIDFGPDVHFGTPGLRGMTYRYLKESLIAYKTGTRVHKEMDVIAAMLDEETIDFMARTFAAYPPLPLKTADEIANLAKTDARFRKGQAIAEEGVLKRDVPACVTCHGELGSGSGYMGLRLGGQNAIYIRRQLKDFADKTRRTAQAEAMEEFAHNLSSDEIDAVAHYYEKLMTSDKP